MLTNKNESQATSNFTDLLRDTFETDVHAELQRHFERSAVASAAMRAYHQAVQTFLEDRNSAKTAASMGIDIKSNNPTDIFNAATLGICLQASEQAAYFLLTNQPTLFTEIFLIRGTSKSESHTALKRYPSENGFHVYLVVKGNSGSYFACSPANLFMGDGKKILENQDLSSLLKEIEANDGGKWPEPSYITNFFVKLGQALPTLLVTDDSVHMKIGFVRAHSKGSDDIAITVSIKSLIRKSAAPIHQKEENFPVQNSFAHVIKRVIRTVLWGDNQI